MQFGALAGIAKKQACRRYSEYIICSMSIIEWIVLIIFSFSLQRCERKGNDAKNPAVLSFFVVINTESQLKAAHA